MTREWDGAGWIVVPCFACSGSRLVVVAHIPECLSSQWFYGAAIPNCADVCPRTDCPICRAAADGLRSD